MGIKVDDKHAISSIIGVVLSIGITLVLAAALYIWVSGFISDQPSSHIMDAKADSNNDSANLVTWSVISSSKDVKFESTFWTLTSGGSILGLNVTIVNNENFTNEKLLEDSVHDVYFFDFNNNGMIDAGDVFRVKAPEDGDYVLRVVYGGSVIWSSSETHY
jgi:hypothetical protein